MGDLQVIVGSRNSTTTTIILGLLVSCLICRTTIEEDVLEHIHETNTPKEAWDTFAKLFSKKNDTKLQLIESRRNSEARGSKKSDDKARNHQSERNTRIAGGSKNHGNVKKFEGKCYNCGKKGHMERDCWSKRNVAESNVVTSKTEDELDFEASFAVDEDE
ncbi:hypothetical protein Sango_2084500 [Sesamum angolense]|uniref:CCHC-type domain-containing protein n=1 Tax=Sesamum angolense TaxID=2727404 RepID=A0AAE2BLY7_9LAMI|nr:hypothetical protein Sango_2084500 [Sesamum angolense]